MAASAGRRRGTQEAPGRVGSGVRAVCTPEWPVRQWAIAGSVWTQTIGGRRAVGSSHAMRVALLDSGMRPRNRLLRPREGEPSWPRIMTRRTN